MHGLVFYWFRGGSSLLNSLLSDNLRPQAVNSWQPSRNCQYLITNPKNICPIEDAWVLQTKNQAYKENIPFDHFLWRAHIGDQVTFPPNLIKKISLQDRVIMLCRDGRNQIESMRNCKGGLGYQKAIKDFDKFFQEATIGFRRRAEFVVQLQNDLKDRFKLVKFEDLLKSPLDTLVGIYNFFELVPDTDRLVEHINRLIPSSSSLFLKHSSFKTLKGVNERWKTWSPSLVNRFVDLSGSALEDLGYE